MAVVIAWGWEGGRVGRGLGFFCLTHFILPTLPLTRGPERPPHIDPTPPKSPDLWQWQVWNSRPGGRGGEMIYSKLQSLYEISHG